MRIITLVMFLAACAFAQAQFADLPAVCGPEKISLDVKLGKSQHALAQPDPGKALIYFIQDNGAQNFGIGVAVVTWIGLDGAWVGANKNNSYFSVSVEPGKHHMCSSVRSTILGHPVEMTDFAAEAGKVYYFRERYIKGGFLFLDSVNSEQAQYLIASYPLSTAQPKK